MNTLANIQELARALRNMIRTGIIVETDLNAGRCRVQTGGMCTDWLQWLTHRAGRSRTWWAPSVGEQVLILAVGGELDTAFVLPGIYSGDNPAPSASADALHIRFPDGAVIEYEPETSALTVADWKHGNATAFWSVVWILQILNGRKCRNKLYELWCELTYLWHRVKPNLTVSSVPKADVQVILSISAISHLQLCGQLQRWR